MSVFGKPRVERVGFRIAEGGGCRVTGGVRGGNREDQGGLRGVARHHQVGRAILRERSGVTYICGI